MVVPKLIVTGDIFRPYPSGQRHESAVWKNVRWLDGIVGTAARLSGWTVTTASWDPRLPSPAIYIDTPAIYEAFGIPLTIAGWGKLLSQPSCPPEVESLLIDAFAADLVVGYEMPDLLLRLLDRAGIAVIDISLYPVRFLDDVVFALRSNRPDIHAVLLQHAVPRAEMLLQAGLLKSKAAWMEPPLRQPLRPGTTVILGQVPGDRALLDGETGRFRCLEDYAAQLLDLCLNSSMVLFKPHPYAAGQSQTNKVMSEIGAVTWVDANVYHLLAQPEVSTVCALNSSVLVEAELFGKDAIWLAPPLYHYGDEFPADARFGAAVPLTSAWCNPDFWSALRGEKPDESVALTPRPNRLRRALNADWGFSSMDKVVA
ncbi:hypothetical protein [Rhodospirillum rubrum]|uniref:Capsule polysaccharide biosynthesis n=1 Tax=Rhodospirillum rubrum (strain ATCC 11170 / ATH 1.1.1 / DSM 467 / LMG 4362 / NCIMB 8255 / S1) TaxID=269796 RepID=Q2RR08_RHORT|nr:hypothetical protein [Rhodospirillum rubrum]ABC23437.1 hypothetical protein Rru_A2640 [Rhodospirillum rubrum ATCC 11170]MBK5955107.1 hypothetical protein [Rhodospirillum rubrum]QXG79408.1 hypothetical protein KUL73_13620 [Rhodospirillum rubrum]HAP98600.1 hypothetical protein [Rhodospirillum rubrum]